MSNPVFSRSECISHYRWGDDCYGWNYVDTDALSIKQELMPPDTAEALHYHEKAPSFFYIERAGNIHYRRSEKRFKTRTPGHRNIPGQKHFISQ
jgi:hypothetical protein